MVQISKLIRKKLSELLIDEGLLKEDQIQDALKRQRSTGEFLYESIVQLGFLSEVDIAGSIVKQFGLPYIDASRYRVPRDALAIVPAQMMWQHHFIVLDKIGKTLIVAVAGVLNGDVFEKIEQASGSNLYVYVSTPSQILAALQKNIPLNGQAQEAK